VGRSVTVESANNAIISGSNTTGAFNGNITLNTPAANYTATQRGRDRQHASGFGKWHDRPDNKSGLGTSVLEVF
jgi:hypothetical protein